MKQKNIILFFLLLITPVTLIHADYTNNNAKLNEFELFLSHQLTNNDLKELENNPTRRFETIRRMFDTFVNTILLRVPKKEPILHYAYITNSSAQKVPVGAAVTFDSAGMMSSLFQHVAGTSNVIVMSPGIYSVSFSVTGLEPNQFALFVNGVVAPLTTFGTSGGTQNNGHVIIKLAEKDVLTLRNHATPTVVTLSKVGGIQTNVNASLLIAKIA